MEHIIHSIEPVFDTESRVLILGTMPSPKSREVQFYYGHPQNRFWRVLAAVLGEELPQSVPEKKAMLLRHRIALWDVLAECEITGASDSSIRNPVANDLSVILDHAPVQAVFTTGATAWKLYTRLQKPHTGIEAVRLPSTSPANCAVKMEALTEAYKAILPWLEPGT
ncbi:DNA-deoxyinosine glycosylase [Hydrogenoanaerobacterium saccharovorans]|uniref:DNA-deoxyinosine glycosylase n=1 Tax=Hydrogenoanaerobacterium saccharovorans TaxID=474960 RepID=A0ABS2GR82_9FIRM|nr:DNA-deoxyinosine glycosylase [Hydrogenoanaerobacterium saccharovorans]MBM6924013.1 DNA-deoxyinosine glycosylase [Hydrogenoanaerobacterium saccharovorans]